MHSAGGTRYSVAMRFVPVVCAVSALTLMPTSNAQNNPFVQLMQKASAHAKTHGAKTPILSPKDNTVLDGSVPVAQLQAMGVRIIPWTTDTLDEMRAVIRTGVDGLISDRPDLLQQAVAAERAGGRKLTGFDVEGHRGGRGLRPENTLPAFEAGLDNLIDTIETDTGVSTDGVSLIWHDQFYNPQSCRRQDGAAYTMENRVYLKDISSTDAQKTFLCDKLHFGNDQKNDPALSPVTVAFAKQEGLANIYVPTYVEQVFHFVKFYEAYYRTGAGKSSAHAAERAAAAAKVHFNIETKIQPTVSGPINGKKIAANHTVDPQRFVDVLCGVIARHHMEARSDVQSFDFRTLVLVEEQFPKIQTVYLTEDPATLSTEYVPASLRIAK